ncbi:MAG: hypothetical protein JO065_03445 [Acidobacteria bacterium]|nr:hypothetical protein [Acidobacteriota bacterium]
MAGKNVESVIAEAQILAAGSVSSDFATRQYERADSDHARQAIQFEIKLRQQLKDYEASDPVLERVMDGGLAFAFIRLAMVEEAAGRGTEEQIAFDRARVLMKKAHPNETLTDDDLRNTVRKFDAATDKFRL